MELETWRPVLGYEGLYEASDKGRVRSVARRSWHPNGYWRNMPSRELRPSINRGGYPTVVLCRDGERWTVGVHRLVAEAFLGPRPDGMAVCHGNDIKTDNRIENLRFDTWSSNQEDRVRLGSHDLAARTHCKNGHEFTPENIGPAPRGRRCRACSRERARVAA